MRSVMESDTMHKIYGNEIESRLVDAMDRMNDKVRETFELSRFNGKKNKEIAEMAGISEKAVEFRIMSALRILREELSDFLIFIIMFWIIRD